MTKLDDANAEVVQAAIFALGRIGPPAQAALPSLKRNLQSADSVLPVASVWAALKIDSDDVVLQQQAVPLLIKALSDPREHIRVEAAFMLGEIGAQAKEAIPALHKAKDEGTAAVQQAAGVALQQLQQPME